MAFRGEINVQIVGEDFEPGQLANEEIARLLGNSSDTPVPDYCGVSVLSAEHIEFLNRVPYVKPTMSGGFVCIFDLDGEVFVTREFDKESHALAAALHFLLAKS